MPRRKSKLTTASSRQEKMGKYINNPDVSSLAEAGLRTYRAELKNQPVDAIYFTLVTALSGPWALNGLVVNGKSKIKQAISTSQRTITVELKEIPPFDFQWSVLFGQDQPKCTPYIVDHGVVTAYSPKRDADAGSTWVSDEHEYPKS
jgi:hypothetical protein